MTLKQLLYSLPPFLTAVLLIALSVMAFWRARSTPTNRLFAILCLMGSLLYIDIVISFNAPSPQVALLSNRIGHLLHPFLIPLFIHFFHAFLNIDGRRWLVGVGYGVAVVLAVLSVGDLMIVSSRRFAFGYFGQAGDAYPVMAIGATLATGYNLGLIYTAMLRAEQSITRNKLKYVFIGFGTLGILSSLNFLPMFGYAVYPPGAFGFIPMAIMAAGVFRYDLLGMDMLIRKSVLYSMVMALLTGAYALVVIAIQYLIRDFALADSFFFPVVLFVLITLLFGPLKNRMQAVVDRFFAKGRYDYQMSIKEASRKMAAILDVPSITRLMQTTFIDGMRVRNSTFFVADPQTGQFTTMAEAGQCHPGEGRHALAHDARLPNYLRQTGTPLRKSQLLEDNTGPGAAAVLTEMDWLDAQVALPMLFKSTLNGFLVLGEKQSGDMFTREDIDLLETLCHQSALAIENARAYHALQTLNRELEDKVAERTRDLREALAEKERTLEQLIRSESLAALGQLVAGVAHELNNPLASVTSLLQSTVEDLQLWDGRSSPDKDLIDDLRFADKELGRAKDIVASLLGLARQTQTYEEQVDLNAVVCDALRVLHNQYKHRSLAISDKLDDDLPRITGNFANLGQVVLNIIKNAIQAVAEDGGDIVLRTGLEDQPSKIFFECSDNGPGIDPALHRDVFKPFFTTKPVGQGTGLGLYVAHEIVRKHQGAIVITNTPRGGTCLRVELPIGIQ